MKSSVGILLISTWKYNKFIDSTIEAIRKYFFKNSNIKIYLHTDSLSSHDADHTIIIEHKPWPLVTLYRYETFVKNQDLYSNDYLFTFDVDILIKNYIDEKILKDFVVVYHSGYYRQRGTPETNPKSTAYIRSDEKLEYVAGGFLGGTKNNFLSACETLYYNIKKDLDNNIIAKWHDESHLNRYVIDNQDIVTYLEPEYMSFGSENTSKSYLSYYNNTKKYKAKIIALQNSQKGFDKFTN
jgi:histo-blood group ABO system transferase